MKRRIVIFGGTVALYAVVMVVAWVVGTRQATQKTEGMLDYAVNDVRVSMGGVIDTLLDHLASVAVRNFREPVARSMAEVAAVAEVFDIDELNVVDRTGRIIATNDPDCLGVDMTVKDATRPFHELTNGVTRVVSQPFRRHAYSNSYRKYLGVPFPGGNGYVQVGLDEARMDRMVAAQLSFLFDSHVGDTICYLCADEKTGALVSNDLKDGMPRTLAELGFDVSAFPACGVPFLGEGGADGAKTFVQRVGGRLLFCRTFVFGGHRFLVIEPEDEFYGSRDMITAALAVLLALVLGGFAFFLDRIFLDSDQLKAFYAADAEARARDMEVAKVIQTSALPVPLRVSPYFRLSASMTPARDVGGDFYDFFMLDSTHLAFLVADVSGKGVTAALYMMTAKTLLKDALVAVRDPAAAFARVNAELCKSNTANMFLTAWGGVLDLESGIVTFANAGHNPPIKVDGTANAEGRRSSYVKDKSGPVLAFMDGLEYKMHTLALKPGDSLFLYTDGVTEALDGKNELFGEERLANAIDAVEEPNPKSLCNVVQIAVAAFSEGVPQADDLTVLAVQYVSRPQRFVRSFPPTQDGIAAASAFLDEIFGHSGSGGVRLSSLHIVIDEICSNIVKHSGAKGFELDIELVSETGGAKLTFIDDGVPYDPLSHEDPDVTLSAAERPIGGLGIMMVRKMSQSMSYERAHDRNYLTVVMKERK